MQTIILKEAQASYQVVLDDTLLISDGLILEKNGQPVAAIVSAAEYLAYKAWREAETHRRLRALEEAAIEREHQAFQTMLPELLKQYSGSVVAIHQGKVIAVGDNRMDVWDRAHQQVNGAPVYVQTVESSPKVYKMPYRKVISHASL